MLRSLTLSVKKSLNLYLLHFIFLYSAVGQTVGAFHRRDCRGDDTEILVARLIDRPIRPMIAGSATITALHRITLFCHLLYEIM